MIRNSENVVKILKEKIKELDYDLNKVGTLTEMLDKMLYCKENEIDKKLSNEFFKLA